MPLYEYECSKHGAFERMRPLAESAMAQKCPECGKAAPRAILSAARLAAMAPTLRAAHATNERSAHEPKSSKQHRHGPGCGCSQSARKATTARAADGSKMFPGRRPWMISH
ncbi:MAG: zinc ribbon domain-containing protein [Gammaproteobacteria bacterium]